MEIRVLGTGGRGLRRRRRPAPCPVPSVATARNDCRCHGLSDRPGPASSTIDALWVELPCQPAAEQRSCGRRRRQLETRSGGGGGGRAGIASRVETVHHGGCSQPAAHGRAAVQGSEHADPGPRSRAPIIRGEEARPAQGAPRGPSSRGPRAPAPGATRRRWRSSRPPSRPPGSLAPSHHADPTEDPHPAAPDRSDTGRMAEPDRRRRSRSGRVSRRGDLGRGPRRRVRRGARRRDRRGRGRSRRADRRRAVRAGRGDHEHRQGPPSRSRSGTASSAAPC